MISTLAKIALALVTVTTTHAAQAEKPVGDASRGKIVFARCAACHDVVAGANRIGPTLKGVYGRRAGSLQGFAYSSALKKKAPLWDNTTLDAYLAAPMKFVPGTKMAFSGLPVPGQRADLIAYLKSTR